MSAVASTKQSCSMFIVERACIILKVVLGKIPNKSKYAQIIIGLNYHKKLNFNVALMSKMFYIYIYSLSFLVLGTKEQKDQGIFLLHDRLYKPFIPKKNRKIAHGPSDSKFNNLNSILLLV